VWESARGSPALKRDRDGLQALTLPPGEAPFVPVVTGFLGKGVSTGAICTLGRGGSDLSATVIGAALDLEEVRAPLRPCPLPSASSANMELTSCAPCIQRRVCWSVLWSAIRVKMSRNLFLYCSSLVLLWDKSSPGGPEHVSIQAHNQCPPLRNCGGQTVRGSAMPSAACEADLH